MKKVNALIFAELIDYGYTCGRTAGPYRIATEIRDAGYTCQVVDFFTKFSWEELYKITDAFVGEETLLVGFSSTFFMYVDDKLQPYQESQVDEKSKKSYNNTHLGKNDLFTINYPFHFEKMIEWFNRIKNNNCNIKIIFGGAKAQHLSAVCDAFMVGYADQAIIEYMKYLEGKNPLFQFERLSNSQIIIYSDQYTNNFKFNTSEIQWHKTDFLQQGEVLPIEISRGCIFKCKFCSYPLNGKKKLDYLKDAQTLKEEFIRNYNEYGVTKYVYADDTHNDSIEKLQNLHKIVQSLPFEIEYAAYLRHDLIYAHKEMATLLRDSGLKAAFVGIESLNYESAKAIGKGLHPDKIKELLYWLKEDVWKDKVSIKSGFIIGLPFETEKTIDDWAPWVLDPACPLDSFAFQPLLIVRNNNNKSRIWRSEFDINAEKYGYSFDINGWKNNNMNRHQAVNIAEKLNTAAINANRRKPSAFGAIMSANLGYIPSDIINRPLSGVYKDYRIREKVYHNRYKQLLLEYIDGNS